MTAIALNDIVVNYSRHGSGPAVVLLHGLAEDHRSWDAVAAHLGSFTTYAVDLRGHGGTTPGQGVGTLSQLRDDLITFLSAVSGPAAVVGYSLGGTIGLKAATVAPALIRHLIVVATSSVVGAAAAGFFAGRVAQIEDRRLGRLCRRSARRHVEADRHRGGPRLPNRPPDGRGRRRPRLHQRRQSHDRDPDRTAQPAAIADHDAPGHRRSGQRCLLSPPGVGDYRRCGAS